MDEIPIFSLSTPHLFDGFRCVAEVDVLASPEAEPAQAQCLMMNRELIMGEEW
jgi:hypothetical protein